MKGISLGSEESSCDRARSPCDTGSPSRSVVPFASQMEDGGPRSPGDKKAQLIDKPVGSTYYVTEPPESPRGGLIIPSFVSSDIGGPFSINEESSPVSSPRQAKRNDYVDIVMAHVFEDLSLKRKASDDLMLEAERSTKLQKAIRQQVWSPFSPSGGNSSAPGDRRKGGTTGRRKRTQTKARVGGISRASAQFDEVGLIEALLILSQEFQVVGDGGGESQVSQVQSSLDGDVSLSQCGRGVVVAVPQQPHDQC